MPPLSTVNNLGEFPDGPVVRTRRFHRQGPGSMPGRGTKIPQSQVHDTKKKKKKKLADITIISQIVNGYFLERMEPQIPGLIPTE